jgi:cyclophilin family peptidyl-prolyl cis-trans isomerase
MTKATITTELGDIEVDLFTQAAPKATQNFIDLAKKGFYDDVIFHRVIPCFVIQAGDGEHGKKSSLNASRVGTGGPGYTFADEFSPKLRHSKPGILSMANRGPNTNGGQFFITLAATPWLDDKHSVFGEIVEGMDVVKKIGSIATSKPGDRPVKPITIESVTIEKK